MAEKHTATFHGTGPSFTDALRNAADTVADPIAAMLTASAWHLDRMTTEIARLTGLPEGAVALSHGLGVSRMDPDGCRSCARAESADVAGRIAPMGDGA